MPDAPAPPAGSVAFSAFSGLRNTVSPERLGPRELARARNIDLDDAGQAHRRRGYALRVLGRFHSVFTSAAGLSVAVKDGTLCQILPDFKLVPLLGGISDAPLAYVEVGPTLYASSSHNSFQVDQASGGVRPWGRVVSPSYQPSLAPGPADWWFSPVVNPSADLGPVGGKLLGAPPPATCLATYNGRIYLGAGTVLWATELFLYDYVDKNRNYRVFESPITMIGTVEDGVYVGTEQALYFLSGTFHEQTRVVKLRSGVVPGTLAQLPADMISPTARAQADLPATTTLALACMSHEGMLALLPGGTVYNLTRAAFVFPQAKHGASLFRYQDGMHTLVTAQDSGGTPRDNARFGDHVDAVLIRAGAPGRAGAQAPGPIVAPPDYTPPAGTFQPVYSGINPDNTLVFKSLGGVTLGTAIDG